MSTEVAWDLDLPVYGGLVNEKPDHQCMFECPGKFLGVAYEIHPDLTVPTFPWLLPNRSNP